ncbi:MAG: hypothetical protein R3253_12395, partial [Longimicrobiales bacterium]|nr:hypothetical protein [Longimicrobiales bacterium]
MIDVQAGVTDAEAAGETKPGDPSHAAADRACHAPFREALGKAESGLASGLVRALDRAAEAHAELMATAGLDGERPDGWEDRAERLVEYRRRLATEVLGPLRVAFEDR